MPANSGATTKQWPTIVKVETFIPADGSDGGHYHRKKEGHWILDGGKPHATLPNTKCGISTPMSGYKQYREDRTSFGIGVLGSLVCIITASDGTQGISTGFGGPPACWLIEQHFSRFVIGSDPRDTNRIWDQMFKASTFYGRKGLPVAAISVVDLAVWDLLGKIRGEPVYKMIGGQAKDAKIPFYLTGPEPTYARGLGFWGSKVALPYSPNDGFDSLRRNLDFLKAHRKALGDGFPLMVDCWMSLNVHYAIQLAQGAIDEGIDITWWEEVLHPDDFDGHKLLKQRLLQVKWTTGEHEYSRYGFRQLIEGRAVDMLQPDVMWMGGLTELLKISAHAAAYDIPVVPHGSGPYSYHFIMSQPHSPFCEYIANSADGKSIAPVFGNLFLNEPVPHDGSIDISDDLPGFGLELNPAARLITASAFLAPNPDSGLSMTDDEKHARDRQLATTKTNGANGVNGP
ncbi:BZ3500_MvSof-1268-A1-R1_Chr3-2g06223 [Microbotryum saponariae]|uniref:BZ3500_MvSof-1268-A1-R1_Chr3-2g06223 protein n=1 Tax=Microbotryum saponariae TaxID=289078 RepID=A0A2X0LGP4_9BASI|nr:BZ3500_MvSof-1268-A1-R1_Chr3-2g06223 [Microbotryum saponariae]SDA04148.1 BZ3501_MvSof-1269-A2-R1_Chr3-2g05914 [Microbotryum saponariae]